MRPTYFDANLYFFLLTTFLYQTLLHALRHLESGKSGIEPTTRRGRWIYRTDRFDLYHLGYQYSRHYYLFINTIQFIIFKSCHYVPAQGEKLSLNVCLGVASSV